MEPLYFRLKLSSGDEYTFNLNFVQYVKYNKNLSKITIVFMNNEFINADIDPEVYHIFIKFFQENIHTVNKIN